MPRENDVVIIGAGLAGLCCARRLREAGIPCAIVEASDDVGGRIRTDQVDGFRLDRGFQVLLTAYPECRRLLDYDALRLGRFRSGALIHREGRFHRLFDPRRHPSEAVHTLASPLLTWNDRLRLVQLWAKVRRGEPESVLRTGLEQATEAELLDWGFSEVAIESFLRPFFAGVFLQQELSSSNRFFRYLFRMFAEGEAALPAEGMQAIPRQIAAGLRDVPIRFHSRVQAIREGAAIFDTGEELGARAIVIATTGPEALRLTGEPALEPARGAAKRTSNLYYAADRPPIDEPSLMLNGEGRGNAKLNNVTVPSVVCPTYAPPGAALVSVQVIDAIGVPAATLELGVRHELRGWFGATVDAWRHLRTYQIPYALPPMDPPALERPDRPVRLRAGLYVCGDHRDQASIQGAMVSGRRAAEAVVTDLADPAHSRTPRPAAALD